MCRKCGIVGVGGCKTWFDLRRIGLSGQGCIRDPEFMASIRVSTAHDLLDPSVYIQRGGLRLQAVRPMPGAMYSYVEIGVRQDVSNATSASATDASADASADATGGMHYVFIKRPMVIGKSLLYEACMQQMVKDSLDRGGFVRGAAAVHDVFRLHDSSVCFSMEIFQTAQPLNVVISTIRDAELTPMLLEILLQLCAMLWHLASDIGMNHRDLKPSNLMVEVHEPRSLVLQVGTERVEITSRYTLSLVDFGFSCIGQSDTQMSDLSLGAGIYSKLDPCPKGGRDFYMFLAFLYIDCWRRLRNDFRSYFVKWLQDDVTGIVGKLERHGLEFDKWIYFITGNERIQSFGSDPCTIFQDLLILATVASPEAT